MVDTSNPRTPDGGHVGGLGEMPAPDVWYYANERGRMGPLSLEELKATLATLPNPDDVLVWASNLPDWTRARAVPELGGQPTPVLLSPTAGVATRSEPTKSVHETGLPPPMVGEATASEPTETAKQASYIIRHWRGKLTLPISFWVNGVLLNAIENVVTQNVFTNAATTVGKERDQLVDAILLPLVLLLALIGLSIWSYVGIWRAAGRRTPAGPDGWGWAARVVVMLWVGVAVFGFTAEFWRSYSAGMHAFQPPPNIATNINSGVDAYGNHYLSLDGPIVPGDPERFAQAIFEANARGYRLDALRLNSRGGDVWETLAMAVMVRWVENMATVVQKDAKCESACFGLFAAGYRKYIDPASDPTQIGVHSVYQLIEHQGGAPALFWKESADTTIWAVRRLKALGVPDSIISKIVTTPPNRMTYLTIEELQQMGVEVTGHRDPGPPTRSESHWVIDSIWLSPAMARANITLDSGAIIPAGTIVVTIDGLPSDEICFNHPTDQTHRMCNISYRTASGKVSTARVRETSLTLISQGWQPNQ